MKKFKKFKGFTDDDSNDFTQLASKYLIIGGKILMAIGMALLLAALLS
jgi:hypothetical protein